MNIATIKTINKIVKTAYKNNGYEIGIFASSAAEQEKLSKEVYRCLRGKQIEFSYSNNKNRFILWLKNGSKIFVENGANFEYRQRINCGVISKNIDCNKINTVIIPLITSRHCYYFKKIHIKNTFITIEKYLKPKTIFFK